MARVRKLGFMIGVRCCSGYVKSRTHDPKAFYVVDTHGCALVFMPCDLRKHFANHTCTLIQCHILELSLIAFWHLCPLTVCAILNMWWLMTDDQQRQSSMLKQLSWQVWTTISDQLWLIMHLWPVFAAVEGYAVQRPRASTSQNDRAVGSVLFILYLSLIHIWRCRRIERCRSRWSPYH